MSKNNILSSGLEVGGNVYIAGNIEVYGMGSIMMEAGDLRVESGNVRAMNVYANGEVHGGDAYFNDIGGTSLVVNTVTTSKLVISDTDIATTLDGINSNIAAKLDSINPTFTGTLNGYYLSPNYTSSFIPTVGSDGVMEIGNYIDMHQRNSSSDHDMRIELNSDNILSIDGSVSVQNELNVTKTSTLQSVIITDAIKVSTTNPDPFDITRTDTIQAGSGYKIRLGDTDGYAVMGYWKDSSGNPYIYFKIEGTGHAEVDVFKDSILLSGATTCNNNLTVGGNLNVGGEITVGEDNLTKIIADLKVLV